MSPGRLVTSSSANAGRVDALLAKQGKADKVLLRRRIEFRKATQPDGKMDLLRKKYKPVNDVNGANGGSGRDKTPSRSKSNKHISSAADSDVPVDGMVESSGFRRPAHSLFPPERLGDGWRSVRPIGPGLSNLGNTCFLNSVLQCLTYTPPLAEYMLTREHSSSCRAGDNCMLCRFEAHVVRALAKREGSSIAPKTIVARLKLVAKQMRIGRQEDAHEFLRLLVDSFQRSLLHGMDPKIDRRIQETSLVHQIFGGYLQSQVTCSKCDHDSNTFDPLLDISLDIQSGSNIAKALRSFTRPEHLVKGNRYKCEKCSKLVDATKQMTVYRLPRILTLQLKRFSIFGGGKINRYVEFPLHLSMKGYTSSNSSSPGIFSYSLYAVLVHAGGTSRSGHYYCFVKSPAGVWYELNDSMVHQVSERTVLKQSAYLLFYERCSAKHCEQASAAATKAKTEPVQHQQNSAKKPSDRHTESAISAASEEMETMLGRLGSRPSSNNPSKEEKQKKKKKKSKSKLVKHHDLSSEPAASATDSASTPERSTRPALGIKGASDEINKLASQLHPKHSLEQTTGSPHKNQAAIAAAAVEKIGASLSDSAKSKDDKKNATNDPASSEWVVRKKVSSAVNGKAQVIGWNEDTASKRAKATSLAESRAKNSWDIAEVRANRKSQYGASVQSWAGTGSAADQLNESLNAPRKRQRRPDSWDTEYDRGRLKKVKKHRHNKFASTINPFQLLGERQGNKR